MNKINPSQRKNMVAAGFRLVDCYWNKDPKNNLAYWERGQIKMIFFRNEKFDLFKFTRDLIGQTEIQVKANFQKNFKELQYNNPEEKV